MAFTKHRYCLCNSLSGLTTPQDAARQLPSSASRYMPASGICSAVPVELFYCRPVVRQSQPTGPQEPQGGDSGDAMRRRGNGGPFCTNGPAPLFTLHPGFLSLLMRYFTFLPHHLRHLASLCYLELRYATSSLLYCSPSLV